MSDIFISYSKADRPVALKLSTFFEAEGWSVWWDKSLGVGDPYRDEIMKQMAAARAVITILSPNSIKSDWVRAEAGRAKADGKLIPVKTADVAYADIPLPFGEMHTENVGSTELIRAAIVAQLAKPAESLSPFRQITSTFKYQILIGGIVLYLAIWIVVNFTAYIWDVDLFRQLLEQAGKGRIGALRSYEFLHRLNDVLSFGLVMLFPVVYLLCVAKERVLVFIASLLFLVMAGCLLILPLTLQLFSSKEGESTLLIPIAGGVLLQICLMAVILFSPLQQLIRRLSLVVLGVLTLVALSEISKLNLHQYLHPPKVSDNSVR